MRGNPRQAGSSCTCVFYLFASIGGRRTVTLQLTVVGMHYPGVGNWAYALDLGLCGRAASEEAEGGRTEVTLSGDAKARQQMEMVTYLSS